nr:HipA N-terminal domain-containing protein [Delftia tsuruhatensis]
MAALGVWMNGERVGTWEVTRTGRHVFAYDPAWPQSAHARPLSLSMPFTRDLTVAGEVVAHYFDNLLPDGEGIRRRIHQRFGLRGIDAFSLLEAIGRDCVGAVQLLPEGAVPEGFDQVRFEPLSEAQIAEHLASLGGGFARWRWTRSSGCPSPVRRRRRRCCAMAASGAARWVRRRPRIS